MYLNELGISKSVTRCSQNNRRCTWDDCGILTNHLAALPSASQYSNVPGFLQGFELQELDLNQAPLNPQSLNPKASGFAG